MKWSRKIRLNTRGDQSKTEEKLWSVFPYAKTGCNFSVELEENDSRIPEILKAFEALGIPCDVDPNSKQSDVTYSFNLWHEYDDSDFDGVKYLELSVGCVAGQNRDSQMRQRLSDELWHIFALPLTTETKIAGIGNDGIIVSDDIRRAMISEGLIGIQFREVVKITEDGDVPMPEFWELYSDIILPPIPNEWLMYEDVNRYPWETFTGDYSRPFGVKPEKRGRGLFHEMHFHEEDVRDIEPFDVAMTHQLFKDGKWLSRRMVMSQRFRRFCAQHNLNSEITWTPVRLDSGRHAHWKRPAPTVEPPLPHVMRWHDPKKWPGTRAAPKKLNILPRRHHRFFTREILPHMLVTSKRDELIPSLCASNSLKLLTEWWNLAGLKVSPPERIPEEGLEILSFEHKSCVCILMTFPPALAPGEAMLGMVMCGPLKRKNAAEIQAAPLRYHLMEQGDVAGESVLVDWKPPEVFETIGPGPKAAWTKLDFTEAIFARNKL